MQERRREQEETDEEMEDDSDSQEEEKGENASGKIFPEMSMKGKEYHHSKYNREIRNIRTNFHIFNLYKKKESGQRSNYRSGGKPTRNQSSFDLERNKEEEQRR